MIMKATTLNGKRLMAGANQPILGGALHHKLPECKSISKRLVHLPIEKFKDLTRVMGIDFYLEVRKGKRTDSELQ